MSEATWEESREMPVDDLDSYNNSNPYIKAADILNSGAKSVNVIIDRITARDFGENGVSEIRYTIHFRKEGKSMMNLNKTNSKALAAMFNTTKPSAYGGQEVKLVVKELKNSRFGTHQILIVGPEGQDPEVYGEQLRSQPDNAPATEDDGLPF